MIETAPTIKDEVKTVNSMRFTSGFEGRKYRWYWMIHFFIALFLIREIKDQQVGIILSEVLVTNFQHTS